MAYTSTTDSAGYSRGTKFAGSALRTGIIEESFIEPNKTATIHVLQDKGEVELPVISTETEGSVTDLCAGADSDKTAVTYENIAIDKKVTGEFDGCFTVTGVADKMIEQGVNDYKLLKMREKMETYIFSEIEENVTDSVNTFEEGDDPVTYLNKLKTEYRRNTKMRARVALVSLEFYEKLVNSRVNLGSPKGDEVFTYGGETVQTVVGLLIIPVDYLTRDVIIYEPAGLNIAFSANTKTVGRGILGAVSNGSVAFQGGLYSTFENASGEPGSPDWRTYVGLPFGVKIVQKEWFLASPEAVVTP